MKNLRQRRSLAALSQHRLARLARVDRSKISLVETGQSELTDAERVRVVRVLNRLLQRRATDIERTLCDGVPSQAKG